MKTILFALLLATCHAEEFWLEDGTAILSHRPIVRENGWYYYTDVKPWQEADCVVVRLDRSRSAEPAPVKEKPACVT